MQTFFIVILLALIFLGVIFLIARSLIGEESRTKKDHYQEILEKLGKLKRDTAELELTVECFSLAIKREFNKWQAEKQALAAAVQSVEKSPNEQQLFLNERYKEIFDLYAQGLSAEQIARKLDKGYGEVSFILQLASQEQKGD
ncbi:DUF6115 domain-containing protein [Neobacillus niacini]|uniref:DUF6115 domain-containing protein n=1 Tax=Neobacillus niacini TaxID=86668 RepID=UPI0028605F18|nr:hypothetical protein [Neobacillus niacini]MDR7001004.1 ATP/maltotriose-dependent transcriptional regulator MalT [Neobacillus niacini]